MRMVGLVAPGCPEALFNCTPATLPSNALAALEVWILLISSECITVAEPVNADFFAVP